MAKITLGEFEFDTKKEAKELYRDILNSADLDKPLEGEIFDYVMALLLNHPNVNAKINNQKVKYLIVSQAKYQFNRCFHLVREDDSIEDFSIGKCIDGEYSGFRKFSIAARQVVEDELLQYKIKYFEEKANENNKVKCTISGELISKDEAHVDHREPFTFSAIVHFFIQSKSIDLDKIEYCSENQYGNIFVDTVLIDEFSKWHKQNAMLRIVSKSKNMSKGYLARVTKTKADGLL
jgi:hypothetical protein